MVLHISHNDLDGVSCGILIKACIPSVHTEYASYDSLDMLLEDIPHEYSTVIITDLGPSEAALEKLAGEKEVILIDHHKSTKQYTKYPFVYHSIGKSATALTYEYFSNQGYNLDVFKNFVDCVNDFDLWLLKREDSLQMNMIFNLLGIERFEKRFFNKPYQTFTSEESMVITLETERRNTYIERAAASVQIFNDKQNRTFAVVFAESYASELGNYIITQGTADYVLIINAQRKKVSLRSEKDVDISVIAMENGGGGHKNAAGFNLQSDLDLHGYLAKIGLIR